MSKPLQSNKTALQKTSNRAVDTLPPPRRAPPQSVTPASKPTAAQRKASVADTKSSLMKRRNVVALKRGEEEVEEEEQAEEQAAEEDQSTASSQLPPLVRAGRAGLLDIDSSTLVPPDGLHHRILKSSRSPTSLSFSNPTPSFTLPDLTATAAAAAAAAVSGLVNEGPEELDPTSLEARLSGMPGSLHLSKEATAKYFGTNARSAFMNRIGYLQKHRDIALCDGEEENIHELYYTEHYEESMALDAAIPFGPDRPDRAAAYSSCFHHPSEEDTNSGSPEASFHERFKAKLRGSAITTNDDVMLMHSAFRSGVDTLNLSYDDFDDGDVNVVAGSGSAHAVSPSGKRVKNDKLDPGLIDSLAKDLTLQLTSPELGPSTSTSQQSRGRHAMLQQQKHLPATNSASATPPPSIITTTNAEALRKMLEVGLKDDDDDASMLFNNGHGSELELGLGLVRGGDESLYASVADVSWTTAAAAAASQLSARSQDSHDTVSVLSTIPLLSTLKRPNYLQNSDISLKVPASPRSTYINACLQEQCNPRASLILRKGLSKKLELQSYGMGDLMGRLLANSLASLPFLQSINIADNRLTDEALYPLLIAVSYIPHLLELNLSQNKVDDLASDALKTYLRRPDCPLERLVLNQADVDDFEAAEFIDAVRENRSLLELEMSNNLIGGAENLAKITPDLVTGAVALAGMVRSTEVKLKVLKLDWNMIRLDGGVDLCSAVGVNQTLTFLDLSYNSLGRKGGIALGKALIANTALRTLKVSNNSLDAMAAFTICAGIIENRGLLSVNIDGNPICEQGAEALMLVPLLCGSRVKLSAARCNISMRDSDCWFSHGRCLGSYSLNMEDGFERAVSLVLLHAVAAHHSYLFEQFDYHPSENAKGSPVPLKQILSDEKMKFLSPDQHVVLKTLTDVQDSASDIRKAVELFNSVDEDGSGEVERDEFASLISSMGIEMSDQRIDDVFNSYDLDQGGSIGLTEFLSFLKVQKADAANLAKDICFQPLMALQGEEKAYVPPLTGVLKIVVRDGFRSKQIKRVLSTQDRIHLTSVATEAGPSDVNGLLKIGMQGAKIRIEEGLKILHTMMRETTDLTKALYQILPQMESNEDAKQLIFQSCLKDRAAFTKLKRAVGNALRPIMGSYNGYFRLDLSNIMDRLCFSRLLEVSATQAHERQDMTLFEGTVVYDLSQKRNWSCFRNECFNTTPITIDDNFAQTCPVKGILEFDFICAIRPHREDFPLPDFRIIKMLVNCNLLDAQECMQALARLQLHRRQSVKGLDCDGHNMYQPDQAFATALSEHLDQFYNSLPLRSAQIAEVKQREATVIYDSQGRVVDTCETDYSARFLVRSSPLDHKQLPFELDERYKIKLQKSLRTALRVLGVDETPVVVTKKGRKTMQEVAKFEAEYDLESVSEGGGRGDGAASEAPTEMEYGEKGDDDEDEDGSGTSATATNANGEESGTEDEDDDGSDEDEGNEVAKLKEFMKKFFAEQNRLDAQRKLEELALEAERAAAAAAAAALEATAADGEDGTSATDIVAAMPETPTAAPSTDENPTPAPTFDLEEPDLDEAQADGTAAVEDSATSAARKLTHLFESPKVHIGVKAKRMLELIEDSFSRVFMCARHLALLLHCFRGIGEKKHTRSFGTYRVEAFIVLLNRVIDLHNIECVFRVLSPFEVACVYARVGFLHLWNPCKPEGCWELDLTRPEERLVFKVLAELSTREPGENFLDPSFRWERRVEGMPGWNLTAPWMTEDGLPTRGLVQITYYSGACKQLCGCRPLVVFRRSLLQLFLIHENDLVEEGFRDRPPERQIGYEYMRSEPARWYTYLGMRQDLTRLR